MKDSELQMRSRALELLKELDGILELPRSFVLQIHKRKVHREATDKDGPQAGGLILELRSEGKPEEVEDYLQCAMALEEDDSGHLWANRLVDETFRHSMLAGLKTYREVLLRIKGGELPKDALDAVVNTRRICASCNGDLRYIAGKGWICPDCGHEV